MVERMDPSYFDWLHWREGSPADFLVQCRTDELLAIRKKLKEHAVGWCPAERLLCRPKIDHKAVMFFKDGHHFWFHLTNKEFGGIFNEQTRTDRVLHLK